MASLICAYHNKSLRSSWTLALSEALQRELLAKVASTVLLLAQTLR
jgi:hypothetical protein